MEQDWTPVILEKRKSTLSNSTTLSKAIPVKNAKEKEKEDKPLPTVTVEIKIAIQQARMNAKMSQKDLAAKMCVPIGVIHSYENGTAIPNNAFLARIEKILNTKIPRLKKVKD